MGGREQNSPIYISRIIPGGTADRWDLILLILRGHLHCTFYALGHVILQSTSVNFIAL